MIFATGRISQFMILISFTILILYLIFLYPKEKIPELRRLAALDGIDEAIGRAVEMGRPVHFTTSKGEIRTNQAAQTIAGLSVLSYTASITAKMDAELIASMMNPEIVPLVEEIIRSAYLAEGVIEHYKPEMTRFISSYFMSFIAGVMGLLETEKPAANIMIGAFWADSLMFAETGHRIGAMQIAGTAHTHQLPFFFAVCDYTLIGEETYVAGAYLSGDKKQISTIFAQDIYKYICIGVIAFGVILSSLGSNWLINLLSV